MRLAAALLGASSMLALATPGVAAEADPATAQPFALGQIVVTAPKVQGVAIDTATLSAEAIYAFHRPTLDEAVNLMPGVSLANTGGSRNERTVYVRGFNRFQVPLSIDGIRVFLPADNRLDYGRFLTPDIAEIQVAKAYVSVLDGPDGMGGAINLVTRKPSKPIEAEARATLDLGRDGEGAGYDVFTLLGTRQDKWYAQASYARNQVNHWDLPGDFTNTTTLGPAASNGTQGPGRRNLSRTEDWRVNVKAGFTPNDTDEYTLSYTKQEGEKGAPLSITDPLSTQRFWTWPYWDIGSLYFLSTTQLNDRLTLKTKIYRNTFDNLLSSFDNANENTQTLGKAFNSYYADKAYGGSVRLDGKVTDADTLGVALYYRRDKHVEWQQSFPSGAVEPHQTTVEDTWSIAAENTLVLSPTLTATAGVSYDWRNLKQAEDFANNAFVEYPLKNGHAFNGQARLDWRPDAATEAHVLVSSRVRFPTIFERFSSRFGGAVSNAGLKPERATNFEIGGSHQYGKTLQLDAAVFYSHLSDVIVSVPFIFTSCTPAGVCTPNPVSQSRNAGTGNYYGLELSATWAVMESLTLGANYTLVQRDLNNPPDLLVEPTDVPTSKGFIYADWRPVPKLHVLPNVDLASQRGTVNTAGTLYYRTGAYAVANIRIDYDLTDKLTVGIGASNLFDASYQLVDGFPEAGRSYFVSARARY